MAVHGKRKLRFEGPIRVVETTGHWGVYAGEQVLLGDGKSFRDDLGVRIREAFQPEADELLREGAALPDVFELEHVRITIERLG